MQCYKFFWWNFLTSSQIFPSLKISHQNLGKILFTEYLVPFEISSILFLSAMVGAVVIGKKDSPSLVKTETEKIEAIQEEMNISQPVA